MRDLSTSFWSGVIVTGWFWFWYSNRYQLPDCFPARILIILQDSKARPHCSTSTPCRNGISLIRSLATTVAIGSRVLAAGNVLLSGCKMGRSRVDRKRTSWWSWESMRRQSDRRMGWRRRRSGEEVSVEIYC